MLSIHQVVVIASKFMKDHSPTILTAVAIAGSVTTTVLAVKATPQAVERLNKASEKKYQANPDGGPGSSRLTVWETIKVAYPVYIPAVAMTAVTIGCIVSANSINTRRNAALLGAYALTETAFKEYQDKVTSEIGQNKERKIRDELVVDQMRKNPRDFHNEMVVLNGTEQWCYDVPSGRYFKSDMESIRKAQNEINAEAIRNMWATQTQFYDMIGLRSNGMSDEFGWSGDKQLEVHFVAHLDETGTPAIGINYFVIPVAAIHSYGGDREFGSA
jgi:hypothetical protein